MRSNDLTPLLRATVGFDRMMNLLDSATRVDEGALSYPPYNIEKTGDDDYRIVMAVAGFGEDDALFLNCCLADAIVEFAEDRACKHLGTRVRDGKREGAAAMRR